MNNKLSMSHEERMAETFGATVSGDELADARRLAEEMASDPVLADFNEKWGDVLDESEIEGLNRIIANLPKLQRSKLTENEQISRLVVIALKLGLHEASELVKRFVDTDPNFSWDDIKDLI